MEAIRYLFATQMKNFPKKLKAKKGSIGLVLFIICYLCFIPVLFSYVDLEFLKGAENFAYLLAMGAFAETPYIMLQFLERKGVVFGSPDIHLMFQAPISPKQILIYGKNKHIVMHALSQFYMVIVGYIVFGVSIPACLAYIFASLIIGTVRDTSLAVLLYGQNKKSSLVQFFKGLIYGILTCMAVSLIYTIATNPFDFSLISTYFSDSYVMSIPVVGWEIALIRMCILGPTLQTVLLTIINVVFIGALVYIAYKTPCNGEYYEDAMEYTEQFEYAIQKRKMGGVYLVGQKNKRKKATVNYKKDGASAYFYKNLLEYKKMPMFIFSSITGILAFLALALCFSNFRGDTVFSFPFCVVMILVFTCIVFQGFGIRWKKEIFSPYFRLIPGKVSVKLFGIVVWEYAKSIIEGLIFGLILTAGIGVRYLPYALLTAIIYACIRSSRMHLSIICNATVSKIFGKFGVTIIEYASILFVIIPVSGIILAGGMFGAELLGFAIASAVSLLFLGLLFLASCFAANKMNY